MLFNRGIFVVVFTVPGLCPMSQEPTKTFQIRREAGQQPEVCGAEVREPISGLALPTTICSACHHPLKTQSSGKMERAGLLQHFLMPGPNGWADHKPKGPMHDSPSSIPGTVINVSSFPQAHTVASLSYVSLSPARIPVHAAWSRSEGSQACLPGH